MGLLTNEETTLAIPSGRWSVDPLHSTVGFELRDMSQVIATIHGRFTDFEGTIDAGAPPRDSLRVGADPADQR